MSTQLLPVASYYQARKLVPSAAKIVKVCGGYMTFTTVTDWQTWRKQR